MKINIILNKNNVIYRICDTAGTTETQLKAMYYSKIGDHYEKSYPIQKLMFEHDFTEIEKRYNAYIQSEIEPLKSNEKLENALLWIIREHEKNEVKWWLTGSAALYVRGIKIEPHDIDIMTYKTEIPKIQKIAEPYIVEPFHHVEKWVVKGFGVAYKEYRIDYAFEPEEWVDNNGYVDFGPNAEKALEEIEWQGHIIKVPKIEFHIRSNEIRNRFEIVKRIKEAICGVI
ncbi:MAG TPA: hypothetical protein PKK26_19150 [Candidatus Wallbacteria bacterium]|nr:hypothetical protein [Candidatus Wallbacteria bacterium]